MGAAVLTRRPLVLVATAAAALGAAGCLGNGVFRCQENYQCGARGYCEASTHVCSFEDDACRPSGRRYGEHADSRLAGRCVDDACPTHPVVEVRGGGAHACVIRGPSGDVACWGAGAEGQLGDGLAHSRSVPAPIAAVDGFTAARALALGARHTCALLEEGTVWCWGANESGQLGTGDTMMRPTPVPVPGLSDIVAIAAGGAFTCAAGTDGTVSCWGRNVDGELGLGARGDLGVPTPTALPSLTTVKALVARDRHACALTATGRISCWGANEQGELGDGTRLARPAPVEVASLAERQMSALAAGTAHTCALESGGALWCWGANQLGELGDGTNESRGLPAPVPLLALQAVTHIAAAGHHTCARQDDGTAWCWGANQAGQLGEGTTGNIGVPIPVTDIEDVVDLASGDTFTCARRHNGTVWCWGDDRIGQLGGGIAIERTAPVRVTALDRAQAITAGGAHTCALQPSSDGAATTVCWGENQAGQLGDGTRLDRAMPVDLKINLNAREVAAGLMHTCLRGGDRSVWCWGRGSAGQLGNGTLIDVVVPTNVNGLADAARVVVGRNHTCVLQQTTVAPPQGRVLCWGSNEDGQLGDGTTTSRSFPVAALGPADVTDLALGGAHTCALHADGTVTCWGRGTEGQLGDAGGASSATPVIVQALAGQALAGVVDLAAGDRHTCAVLGDDQTVRCWGEGRLGQLGYGSSVARTIPSKVKDLAGAVEVTAGDNHTCARDVGGSVYCWGDNASGQLGDGSRLLKLQPAQAVVASAVDAMPLSALALAAGGGHSCALRSDQVVVCWGLNSAGQLGDGAILQHTTAQPVRIQCP